MQKTSRPPICSAPCRALRVFGHLPVRRPAESGRPGTAVPERAVTARIRQQYPKDEEKLSFKLVRPGLAGDFFGAPVRAFLAGVLGLAGIVLLAACANLGGLMFAARTADRTREIAIRMAVGSSRWRVVRQILVEAIVISIFGGACACGLAWIALSFQARRGSRFDPTGPPNLQIFYLYLLALMACLGAKEASAGTTTKRIRGLFTPLNYAASSSIFMRSDLRNFRS